MVDRWKTQENKVTFGRFKLKSYRAHLTMAITNLVLEQLIF